MPKIKRIPRQKITTHTSAVVMLRTSASGERSTTPSKVSRVPLLLLLLLWGEIAVRE